MVTGHHSIDASWSDSHRTGADRIWRQTRRHSRLVRVLRIGLPAVSLLVVLGMLFSLRSLPLGIPDLDLGDIGVSGSTLTMERPSLSGFGERGMGYEVTAERARQNLADPEVVRLETISGRVQQPGGGWATLDARSGVYDSKQEHLRLEEDIIIRTHDGKRAFLHVAEVDLKAQTVVSDRPVRLELPGGRVRADRMEVSAGGESIVLSGRVSLDMRLDGGSIYEVSQ